MTCVVAFSCYALHAATLLAFSSCSKLFLYGVPEIVGIIILQCNQPDANFKFYNFSYKYIIHKNMYNCSKFLEKKKKRRKKKGATNIIDSLFIEGSLRLLRSRFVFTVWSIAIIVVFNLLVIKKKRQSSNHDPDQFKKHKL